MISNLQEYKDVVTKCSHCGLCQSICPIYMEDMLETNVARARLDIINQTLIKGTMAVTPRVKEIVNRCLMCTNCTQSCGGSVPVHEVVVAARYQLYKGKRQSWPRRKFLEWMMEHRGIKGIAGIAVAIAQKLHLAPEGMPAVNIRQFDSQYKGVHPARGERRARVAYYVGCATNMNPETGVSVMKVLAENGVEVVIPDGLTCCGIPAMAEGDLDLVRRMVQNNIKILASQQVDAIITDCTSCGMMLRAEAVKVLSPEDAEHPLATALAPKIFEVTDYLNTIGLTATPGALAGEFTYHVPCHRGWTATLNEAPVRLLSQIPSMRYAAMDEPEKCCGAGGAFFMEYGKLAKGIRSKKIRDIMKTGAKIVISQCPSCRSYLDPQLGKGQVSMHPVTLLWRAYEQKGR